MTKGEIAFIDLVLLWPHFVNRLLPMRQTRLHANNDFLFFLQLQVFKKLSRIQGRQMEHAQLLHLGPIEC